MYESDRFADFVAVLNTKLYPLGEAVGGMCFIVISENEHVYLMMQEIMLIGRNINEGLESLLIGVLGEKINNSGSHFARD